MVGFMRPPQPYCQVIISEFLTVNRHWLSNHLIFRGISNGVSGTKIDAGMDSMELFLAAVGGDQRDVIQFLQRFLLGRRKVGHAAGWMVGLIRVLPRTGGIPVD